MMCSSKVRTVWIDGNGEVHAKVLEVESMDIDRVSVYINFGFGFSVLVRWSEIETFSFEPWAFGSDVGNY